MTQKWSRRLAKATGEWLEVHPPVLEGSVADRPTVLTTTPIWS
ncbi:hypothetical protein [Kyrpidia tusciae]|nr:hypothetical protein [Kyrpidia tusciae]